MVNSNQYYMVSDGWFDYYVNTVTGEKKFRLDPNDICVDPHMDDFYREQTPCTEVVV